MLTVTLDSVNQTATLSPNGALSANDFHLAAKTIDPFIEKNGALKGILIVAQTFPGWDSFSGFLAHLRFVQSHHQHVKHIALVTDSPLGNLAEHLASHFISAKIKHFDFAQLSDAKNWILNT
jgi:hypothetical protein